MNALSITAKFLFFFAGTFLHEAAHFITGAVFGNPSGFSLLPKIRGDSIIYGQVTTAVRYKGYSMFIAAAPLVWWVVLYKLLRYFQIARIEPGNEAIHLTLSVGKITPVISMRLFVVWLLFQLFWAGKPSTQDIKSFLGGLFSLSGVIIALAGAGVFLLAANFL